MYTCVILLLCSWPIYSFWFISGISYCNAPLSVLHDSEHAHIKYKIHLLIH